MITPPSGTHYLAADQARLIKIWKILAGINGIFDDFMANRLDLFLASYMQPNTVWLERDDGNGILYLTDVVPHLSAKAHIVYWDKKLRGREKETLEGVRWAINAMDLKKVRVELPDFAKAAIHFVVKMGFHLDGTMRRLSYSGGRLYDLLCYSMLDEEAYNGIGRDGPAVQSVRKPNIDGSKRPDDRRADGDEWTVGNPELQLVPATAGADTGDLGRNQPVREAVSSTGS